MKKLVLTLVIMLAAGLAMMESAKLIGFDASKPDRSFVNVYINGEKVGGKF